MDEMPDWLAEVLHVVWAVERREHQTRRVSADLLLPPTLSPEHARVALEAVPEEVLRAARIDRSGRRDAVAGT